MPINGKYEINTYLTSGADGLLYTGKYDDNDCVVKELSFDPNEDIPPRIMNEINILMNLKHNNIIYLHGIVQDIENGKILLFFENGGTTIYNYFMLDTENFDKFIVDSNLKEKRDIAITQLKEVLYFVHELNYVHGDLSLKNILIDNNSTIKLIDFATTTKSHRYQKILQNNMKPTSYINPPELLNGNENIKDGRCVDIFALGCVLYFILFGIPLFYGVNEDGQMMSIEERLSKNSDNMFKLLKGHELNDKINSVQIKSMIQLNHLKRPSMRIILNRDDDVKKNDYNNKPNNITITEKIKLVNIMLENENVTAEVIILTLNNATKLNEYNIVKGIILYWISINLVENCSVNCNYIKNILYKNAYNNLNDVDEISTRELIKKKYNLMEELEFKIDDPTVYDYLNDINLNTKKAIIMTVLLLTVFTTTTININMLETVINNHKFNRTTNEEIINMIMLNKYNNDVFEYNYTVVERIYEKLKNIVKKEK